MAPKTAAVKALNGNRPWEGQRVLIVDDSKSVRDQHKVIYEALGMHVAGFAGNGVEALAQIESLKPDLISLDIIMPEMDGIECYRKIQALGLEAKCVIISWIGGEPSVLENLAKIVPPHIIQQKPVAAHDLIGRLEKVYGLVAADAPSDAKKKESDGLDDLAFSSLKVKIS